MWIMSTTYEYVKRCIKDMSFKISKEELEHLYWKDELSTYKIAEMYGVSNSTVGTKMKSYGISRRNLSECKVGDKNSNFNNGEKLKDAWARGCYSSRDVTGSKNPNYKNRLEQMECDFCGILFPGYPSQHQGEHVFCTSSCASKYRLKHSTKIRPGVKGYKHSQETKEKIRESRKNLSAETLKKMSEAQRGRKHSEETLKKMSEAHSGKKNHNYGKPMSEKQKRVLSELAKRRCSTLQWKEKMEEIWKKRRVPKSYTLPERIFIEMCEKHNLPFRYTGDGSFWIKNLNPDFVDCNGQKIAVEVFGDYWHSPLLNKKIKYYQTYDGRKKILEKYGWKLVVLWESDLKRHDAEEFVLDTLLKEGVIQS